jgi:hypothetical protein
MYCKYCGKQIDDDSVFCQHCGKSLSGIIQSSNYLKSFFKKHFVFSVLLIIWYLIVIIIVCGNSYSNQYYGSSSYDYNKRLDFGKALLLFFSFTFTAVIIAFLYWLFKNKCKYHFVFFDKTDTVLIKVLKYAFLAYTYLAPFIWLAVAEFYIEVYFGFMFLFWLVPALIIWLIYYCVKSRQAHKQL